MPLVPNGPAPYAPPKTVVDIISAYREKGLKTPFTIEVLTRAGVPDSLAPRTLQAMKLLDLIDSEGRPSEQFDQAVRMPDGQFREALQDILLAAYSDVFSFADPASEGMDRVRDAFRTYSPRGQQSRMVTLFLGLLEYLGLDTSAAKAGQAERPARQSTRKATTTRSSENGSRRRSSSSDRARTRRNAVSVPDPIMSLLDDALPLDDKTWNRGQRDAFVRSLEALLDLYFPVSAIAALPAGVEVDQDLP